MHGKPTWRDWWERAHPGADNTGLAKCPACSSSCVVTHKTVCTCNLAKGCAFESYCGGCIETNWVKQRFVVLEVFSSEDECNEECYRRNARDLVIGKSVRTRRNSF